MKCRFFFLCLAILVGLPAAADAAAAAAAAAEEDRRLPRESVFASELDKLVNVAERQIAGLSADIEGGKAENGELVSRRNAVQKSLREQVLLAARRVEEQRQSAALENSELGAIYSSLPEPAKARVDGIVAGVARNNVGIASIYFALQLFFEMNNRLINEAQGAQSPMQKRELYMMQAAYVFEIADVATQVINSAELDGLESLRGMRDDTQSRISRRLAEINVQRGELRGDAKAGKLSDENARRMERSYVQIIKANQEVISAWDDLLESTQAQQVFLDDLPRYASQIEQKQQLARFQLDTLRDVLMVGASLNPLERMDGSMRADQLPILVLDEASVLQLVGGPGATDVAR